MFESEDLLTSLLFFFTNADFGEICFKIGVTQFYVFFQKGTKCSSRFLPQFTPNFVYIFHQWVLIIYERFRDPEKSHIGVVGHFTPEKIVLDKFCRGSQTQKCRFFEN